jgi:hypothetical protein
MFKKKLNIIGEIDIDKEFDIIFSKDHKFLITNVIGDRHYFEMTGEIMYYALKEYEQNNGISQIEKKRKIVDALLNRKYFCGGAFYHKSFNGEKDTQLRATSAVIRTLLASEKDGFKIDKVFKEVCEHHFSFYFRWKDGIWFCHDSSELDGKTPTSHLKTKAWGKESRNTVTLNTHLDSLTSLLMAINAKDIGFYKKYKDIANKGVVAINTVLETTNKKTIVNTFLQNIDAYLFNKYLKKITSKNKFNVLYQKIVHPFLFKILSPTLFFSNGFIGRDLSVANIHVDYLVVNVTDFLRLLVTYDSLDKKTKENLGELNRVGILAIVTKAINLIETNRFLKRYIYSQEIQLTWYAEIHYLFSFYSSKYKVIVKELTESNLYNLETTSFVENFNAKQNN